MEFKESMAWTLGVVGTCGLLLPFLLVRIGFIAYKKIFN